MRATTSREAAKAQELVARLQASPAPAELVAALQDFRASFDLATESSSYTLQVYASLLTTALIPLFVTESNVVNEFVRVFGNAAGLGALVSRLAVAPQHEVDALVRVLQLVLEQPGIVDALVRAQPKQASSLVFGSRILNVAASRLTHAWLADAPRYTAWLARQLVSTPALATQAPLFDRAAKLGAPAVLVATYLEPEHFEAFRALWPQLRAAQRTFVLARGLVSVLPASPAQAGRLLLDLGVDAQLFYDVCLRLPAGVATMRAGVVLARESGKLLTVVVKLVDEWSSRVAFECSALAAKQSLTQLIVASCGSLAPADAAQISHSAPLLDGVSMHLGSSSENVRKLGTLVAETFAKQAGQKLEFGITYDDYEWWLGFDAIDTAAPRANTSHLDSILRPDVRETSASRAADAGDSDDEDEQAKRGRSAAADDDDDYIDSDEEVVPPFYIKDLVAYLQSDKYGEVHAGLSTGAALIARKAQFGSEVPQYAPDLLRVACALTDKFSITKFAELRQGILNATLVADAKQAPLVVTMFRTGEWSLAQRQSLLTALVSAAHALAQGQNRGEWERLPPALHRLFATPEDTDRFAVAGMNKLSISADAPASPGGDVPEPRGTVVRRSQRLDTARAVAAAAPQRAPQPRNLFSRVAHLFFFPLVAAAPPLRASSYDALIYAQWLRTLGVIVVEAFPTQHMPDMVHELWPVLVGLAVRGAHEVVIEEALYTCLLMVISVAGGIIIQSHAADIGVLIDKIYARMQAGLQPRTQQLAAAAGAKLAEMAAEIERRMFGGATAPA